MGSNLVSTMPFQDLNQIGFVYRTFIVPRREGDVSTKFQMVVDSAQLLDDIVDVHFRGDRIFEFEARLGSDTF